MKAAECQNPWADPRVHPIQGPLTYTTLGFHDLCRVPRSTAPQGSIIYTTYRSPELGPLLFRDPLQGVWGTTQKEAEGPQQEFDRVEDVHLALPLGAQRTTQTQGSYQNSWFLEHPVSWALELACRILIMSMRSLGSDPCVALSVCKAKGQATHNDPGLGLGVL